MQCNCYARRDSVWRGPGTPWMIESLLCFASDPAKTWPGWLYRQLGPHLDNFTNVSAGLGLGLTKPSFGPTHFFQCFCWAGLGLGLG